MWLFGIFVLVDCIFIAFVEVTCAFLFSFFLGVVKTILSASSSFFIHFQNTIYFISIVNCDCVSVRIHLFCYRYVVFYILIYWNYL